MSENVSPVPPERLAALRAAVRGPVRGPQDPAYTAECANYNLLRVAEPAVVVGAADPDDVVAAVRFAGEHRLPVAVKNAGHQIVLPSPGSVLVSTRRLKTLEIDAGRRKARVGAGVRWYEVVAEAAKAGLTPVAGSAPHVGVVGYTLGGGHSPLLGRTHGYAADHVGRIQVVTADGVLRDVTPAGEPDLFWALLGGKGNFGAVTEIEFDLFPVSRFLGGGIFFRGEDLATVLRAWRTWQADVPEEMTTSVAVQRLPDAVGLPDPLRGRFVVHVRVGFVGPAAEGEELVAPLRSAAPVLVDTVTERPIEEIGEIHLDPVDPLPYVEGSVGLREFSAGTLDAFVELTGPGSGCPLVTVEVRALGGALDREPATPNAVPRGMAFTTFGFGVGGPGQTQPMEEYLERYVRRLAPWAHDHNLVNFVGPDDAGTEEAVRRMYGHDRYRRLAAVKKRYDRANMFRFNHNIRPA
jgi:hypothetical protein